MFNVEIMKKNLLIFQAQPGRHLSASRPRRPRPRSSAGTRCCRATTTPPSWTTSPTWGRSPSPSTPARGAPTPRASLTDAPTRSPSSSTTSCNSWGNVNHDYPLVCTKLDYATIYHMTKQNIHIIEGQTNRIIEQLSNVLLIKGTERRNPARTTGSRGTAGERAGARAASCA